MFGDKRRQATEDAIRHSVASGASLARLMVLNNPGWTTEQARVFSNTLKPLAPLVPSYYKASFLETFKQEKEKQLLQTYGKQQFSTNSGNQLPQKGEK